MSVRSIGDEELLDYVLEKDFEDTTSRIILYAVSSFETGVGKGKLTKLLLGKDPGFILSGNFPMKDHFGRLSLLDRDQVLDFIESLVRLGTLEVSDGEFSRLTITKKGSRSLKKDSMIPAMIPWPLPARELPLPVDPELYEDLKKERNRIAREEGMPPYCVAPNLALVEIVNRGVTEPSDLGDIHGFGDTRIERYGEKLLSILQPIG